MSRCKLCQRRVLQFKEVFLTPRYLGIAMEYAGGGDMFEFFVRNKARSPRLTFDLPRLSALERTSRLAAMTHRGSRDVASGLTRLVRRTH